MEICMIQVMLTDKWITALNALFKYLCTYSKAILSVFFLRVAKNSRTVHVLLHLTCFTQTCTSVMIDML